MSRAARECVPFSIECKNTERLNVWSALTQAQTNREHEALLIFSKNRSDTYAVLRWPVLLELLDTRRHPAATIELDKVATTLIDTGTRIKAMLTKSAGTA